MTQGQPGVEGTWHFQLCAIKAYAFIEYCMDETCEVTILDHSVPPHLPASLIAQAAEVTVAILDEKPEYVTQVRGYVSQPDVVEMVFGLLDSNADGVITLPELDANVITAPFSAYYHTGRRQPNIEAISKRRRASCKPSVISCALRPGKESQRLRRIF